MRRAIVWFRSDLRLHDNEALTDALNQADQIIPIYIFDERVFFNKTKFGFRKTGKYRANFIIKSVINLKKKLQNLGSDLIIEIGKPEDILYEKARSYKTHWVFCNRERTQEEVKVQDSLEQKLWSIGQEVRYYRGKMLYYTGDLPFPITHCPDSFTNFRKEIENFVTIRSPLPSPSTPFPPLTLEVDWGYPPSLSDLGHEEFEIEKGFSLQGGEDAALNQLQSYLWETDSIQSYKETKNGLLASNYSSKLSPYLSLGNISPKLIYHEICKYEHERMSNDSTYCLKYDLMLRDFYRLMGKKHGNAIFKIDGLRDESFSEKNEDAKLFDLWKSGNTGIPFIDANMRELNSTGYMSSRGRKNISSFLVKDLKLNWQLGASYFESQLIDYDPCSNYGNWNYIAGIGSDSKESKYFNIHSQAKKYDPKGDYVKYWIPELSKVPYDRVHQLDNLSGKEQKEYGIIIGKDYPDVCISPINWH